MHKQYQLKASTAIGWLSNRTISTNIQVNRIAWSNASRNSKIGEQILQILRFVIFKIH